MVHSGLIVNQIARFGVQRDRSAHEERVAASGLLSKTKQAPQAGRFGSFKDKAHFFLQPIKR